MKRAIALLLAGGVLAVGPFIDPPAALAQTQTQAPALPPPVVMPPTLQPPGPLTPEQEWLLLHFSSQYTDTMIIGLIAGGLMGNVTFGGVAATVIGGVLGASVGSYWFYHRLSNEYLATHRDSTRIPFVPRASEP